MRLLFLVLILSSITSFAQTDSDTISINELEARIARLVEVNNIPAVGLALIDRNGFRVAKSFGMANREQGLPATENTMYRLGSVSKMLAGLSVLILVERGKLSLEDKVRELVPEVEFANHWQNTHPLRLKHLLNHTSGWDDIHGAEWMSNDPTPLTSKQAMDLHPHTRISRWPPGTRRAYSNAGPPVAAYIVEKYVGLKYEDFVQKEIFDPLGMKSATFLYSDQYRENCAINYRNGHALPYEHLAIRPSGSLNCSPSELLRLLDLFLGRGSVDSHTIVSESSMQLMETPPASFGFDLGYGLTNFSSLYKGFKFQGHNGAINNAVANLAYLPEYNLGFVLTMTEMNSSNFNKLNELVKDYLIQNIKPTAAQPYYEAVKINPEIEGFYNLVSSRNHKFRVIQNLMEPVKIYVKNDTLYYGSAFNRRVQKYIAVNDGKYIGVASGRPGLNYKVDYDGTPILYKSVFGGVHSFKPTSAFLVYGKLIVLIAAVIFSLVMIILGFVWLIQIVYHRFNNRVAEISMRTGPVISSLVLIPLIVLFLYVMNHPFDLLFLQNAYTNTLYGLSILYGIAAIWSIFPLIRNFRRLNGDALYIFLSIVIITHFLLGIYFLSQDIIAIKTWS